MNMMWNRRRNIISFAALALSGAICSCTGYIPDEEKALGKVYLSAVVNEQSGTRSGVFEGSIPSESNPLVVDVWASTTQWEYQHIDGNNGTAGQSSVNYHTYAKFHSSEPQLLGEAVYPANKNDVFFVAFHPKSEGDETWERSSSPYESAQFKFDGNDDVMFSAQVQGKYADNHASQISSAPTFTFNHLLTWLKINIKAEDEMVVDAWGKLKDVKLLSSNRTVTVTLAENDHGTAVFSDPGDFEIFSNKDDGEFPSLEGYTLEYGGEHREVAYVLCAPVEGTTHKTVDAIDLPSEEYTLLIETEKRKVILPVDLRKNAMVGGDYKAAAYTGSTAGRHFTINLTFKMGNSIAVSAMVQDWKLGGVGSALLDPYPAK